VRLAQNFLASGEIMGGAILLLEGAHEKKHDVLSSLYGASTIGGILLASLGVSVLCQVASVESGWRVLYVIGGITAFFGCMIRVSQKVIIPHRARPPLVEIGRTLWAYRRAVSLIAVSAGFSYASYSVALVLINGLVPLVTSITKEHMMQLNSALLILDFAMLPLCGWISSKISREKLMIGASLGVVLSALPLFLMLEQGTWASVVSIRVFFVFLGVAFSAPLHAWAQRLVPEAHRYLVISFGYAIGSQLLGAPTAAISLWLFKETGVITSVAWYWMALALVAAYCISLQGKLCKVFRSGAGA
jgi:MHS family proline/betaine transporter-like MFS transporter